MTPFNKRPFTPAEPVAADPVAWIFDCHARIAKVAGGLRALAEAGSQDPRAAATARACERYLRLALPLHARDEDESLTPRLLAATDGIEIDRSLERMAAEHGRIHAGLPAALLTLDRVVAGQDVPVAELDDMAGWYEGLLVPHIKHEERIILPATARLSPAILAQIATEMRARRTSAVTPESP